MLRGIGSHIATGTISRHGGPATHTLILFGIFDHPLRRCDAVIRTGWVGMLRRQAVFYRHDDDTGSDTKLPANFIDGIDAHDRKPAAMKIGDYRERTFAFWNIDPYRDLPHRNNCIDDFPDRRRI